MFAPTPDMSEATVRAALDLANRMWIDQHLPAKEKTVNEVTHTPGPWEWYGPSKKGITFDHEAHVGPGEGNDSGGPIAAVSGDDDEQAVGNARLIAAAPAYAMAWELVPEETRQRIFDALHSPGTEWVESAITTARGV